MIGTVYFQTLEEMADLPYVEFMASQQEDFRSFYDNVFKPAHSIETPKLRKVSCYYCLQNIGEESYMVIDEIEGQGAEIMTNFHERCFDYLVLNQEKAIYSRHLQAVAALAKN